MAVATQVSLEEYLSTTYRPDCDYIDGEVQERSVGERLHALLHSNLVIYLGAFRRRMRFEVMTEMRIQVARGRFRIPDICVVLGQLAEERYLTTPPFLCIEILSERDTLDNIQDRVDDYLAMGVPNVWVVSPRTKRGWMYRPGTIAEAKDGILRTTDPEITVPLAEVCA